MQNHKIASSYLHHSSVSTLWISLKLRSNERQQTPLKLGILFYMVVLECESKGGNGLLARLKISTKEGCFSDGPRVPASDRAFSAQHPRAFAGWP